MDLVDAVLSTLPDKGVRHLVVAATRLRFCDLCGLRAMIRVHSALAAGGGGLAIAEPVPALQRLLELTGLTATPTLGLPIRVCTTLDEAVDDEIGGQAPLPVSGQEAYGEPGAGPKDAQNLVFRGPVRRI